jgi:hypothetical protein
MTLPELWALGDGRVADFMTHDRVAFGGTLIGMGILYLWLIAVPLARGERWAWRLIASTGAFGFASFLAYAGSGYIDAWHATASVAMLAAFVPGLALSHRTLSAAPNSRSRSAWPSWRTPAGLGRRLVALTGVGMLVAGLAILALGSIVVFVPQDLIYIGFDRAALDALNVRLVPLIAHDRTGFGGGVATTGLLVLGVLGWGTWSRSLWQALGLAGLMGFGAAVGVHALVGYLDASHVAPALAGAVVFAVGMWMGRPDPIRASTGQSAIRHTPADAPHL